jgi:hypothetical protein
VGDIVGLDDVLMILGFLPEQANASHHIAPVIGDDLHRHAQTFADRAEVSRDGFAVAVRQHLQREHLHIVMARTVALAA